MLLRTLILFFGLISISYAERPIAKCSASYYKNYDGDTVTVNINDLSCLKPVISKMPIRIYGIDTPEIRGKCAQEKALAYKVKAFVQRRLKNKTTKVIIYGKDKYFRLLGDFIVTYYGKTYLLSELLIKKGYAVRYTGGRKTKDWCKIK